MTESNGHTASRLDKAQMASSYFPTCVGVNRPRS